MKPCVECGRKLPLSDFYQNARMTDGHLNQCKSCVKDRMRKHRRDNDHVREYDRERSKTPERVKHIAKNTKRWREANPEKYKAQNTVNNAIRDGKLEKGVCACGEPRVHGHHHDYSKPLDVIWLCALCHSREHHKEQP